MAAERKAPYIQGKEALSILPSLIEESVFETQDLQRQFVDFRPHTDILSWHKKTDRFRLAYSEAQRLKKNSRKPGDKEKLRPHFAGRVFQDIAYSACAVNCDESRVVFSPEITLEFWRMLYPNKKIVYHLFNLNGLDNTYVPNGLLIDKSIDTNVSNSPVFEFLEYSLGRISEENVERQLRVIKDQQDKFPSLFAQTSVEFVIPRTFPLPRLKDQEDRIKFLQLSITRVEFGHFVNGVYNGMR